MRCSTEVQSVLYTNLAKHELQRSRGSLKKGNCNCMLIQIPCKHLRSASLAQLVGTGIHAQNYLSKPIGVLLKHSSIFVKKLYNYLMKTVLFFFLTEDLEVFSEFLNREIHLKMNSTFIVYPYLFEILYIISLDYFDNIDNFSYSL